MSIGVWVDHGGSKGGAPAQGFPSLPCPNWNRESVFTMRREQNQKRSGVHPSTPVSLGSSLTRTLGRQTLQECSYSVICKNYVFTPISTHFSSTFAIKAKVLSDLTLFPQLLSQFKDPDVWPLTQSLAGATDSSGRPEPGMVCGVSPGPPSWHDAGAGRERRGWMTQEALVSRMFKQQLGNEVSTLLQNHGKQFSIGHMKIIPLFSQTEACFHNFCSSTLPHKYLHPGQEGGETTSLFLRRCHTKDHQPLTHSTAFWTNYPEQQHTGFPPQAGTEVFTVKFAVLGYCFHQCFLRSEVTVFLSCQVQWPILTLFMQINHLLISLLMRCLQQQIDNEDS